MTDLATAEALQTLASYVPPLVVRLLARQPQAPLTPSAEHVPAAVLFADVSGFTPLAERLAARGPVGAETLNQILNAYFGRLIDVIAEHGGEVEKFAGDALLALWPAQNHDLTTATRRAAQCGLAMQAAVASVASDDARLALKIVIGVGDVVVMQLGGVAQRWECVLTGAPLVQVSLAEPLAEPGEVMLSPEAWQLIRDVCTGTPLRVETVRLNAIVLPYPLQTAPALPVSPQLEPALRQYIPEAVLTRLAAGQADWLADLRAVTVLFINLPISHWTPLAQAQGFMVAVQTVLERFEGSINKMSVDEKGVSLVAALGLPPLAHEDDAVRGIGAAMAIHTTLTALQCSHAIGVTTGRVFCGIIGSAVRREYTMIGDTVNLAARLMNQADDAILTDTTTYEAARSRMDFATLPPLTVKGKTEPVAVYQPRGVSHPTLHTPTAIVGRTSERAQFAQALDQLQHQHQSRIVLLEGAGGIGKTRLVADLIEQARARNITSLLGAGDSIEHSTLYFVWRSIFSQLFELTVLPDDAVLRRTIVLEHLAPHPAALRLAPLLNDLLALDLPNNAWTAQMSGQVRADNIRGLCVQLLLLAAQRAPISVIIEDAHWIDSASWALLMAVQQQVQPLLLVVATRPLATPTPSEWQRLRDHPTTSYMLLDSLDAEQAIKLVCQRLGVAALPEVAARLIMEKAEGHPFWSEEVAYALRDAGVLKIENGSCRLAAGVTDVDAIHVPDTIQGVITSRIDRLSPSQQLVLKVASVIGRVFWLSMLLDIYPVANDKPHLPADLTNLASLDITPLETALPTVAYFFKHAITQDVAYNLMPFAQRRMLHATIATWYEQTHRNDLAPYYPALVHHWRAAANGPKLLAALEAAGAYALRSGAYHEAATSFRHALVVDHDHTLGSSALQRARWERQLGEALGGLGDINESRVHLERALQLLGQPVPTGNTRVLLHWAEQIAVQLGRRVRPVQVHLAERDVALEAARAYQQLWAIYNGANAPISALSAAWRMLNLAEAAGPSPELAQAYALVCFLSMAVPPVAAGFEARAQQVAHTVVQPAERSRLLVPLGRYHAYTGQWSLAEAELGQALEIAQQLGDRREWEEIAGDLALHAYHQGLFARGVALGEQISASARQRETTFTASLGLYAQALNLLPLGQVAAAIERLEAALPLLEGQPSELYLITTWGLLALAYQRSGAQAQARQAAVRVMQVAEHSAPAAVVGFGYPGAGEVLLTLSQQSSAPAERTQLLYLTQRAVKLTRQAGRLAPIFQPLGLRLRGIAAAQQGQGAKAQAGWWRALQVAQRLSLPYETALIHLAIAQYGAAAERTFHASIARDGLAQLGADAEQLMRNEPD